MVVPLTTRIINTKTGEILFTKVFDDFVPSGLEYREKLYRYCDCLCRGIEMSDRDTLKMEFYVNRYPDEINLF